MTRQTAILLYIRLVSLAHLGRAEIFVAFLSRTGKWQQDASDRVMTTPLYM